MDVTECRKSYLGFEMKKKGRNIVRQKKDAKISIYGYESERSRGGGEG